MVSTHNLIVIYLFIYFFFKFFGLLERKESVRTMSGG